MRLLIAAVGKLKQGPERELYAHYLGRAEALGRTLSLTPLASLELAESRAASAPARQAAEAEALLGKVPPAHTLICLDPGRQDAVERSFRRHALAKVRDGGAAGLVFLVGGADGLGRGRP